MQIFSAILSLALVVPSYVFAAPQTVESDLVNSQGKKIGKAMLTETDAGVKVKITASQLPPGEHGIHFHEVGVCNPPSFKSAGEHFSPMGKQHGLNNPDGAHAGDLPNLKVSSKGKGEMEVITPRVTLGPGQNSLLKEGTTAIVIHAKVDDQVSQPSGASGDRIACAVLRS